MPAVIDYIQGEQIPFSIADAAFSTVQLRYGQNKIDMTLSDGVWSASVDSSGLSGKVNFAVFADGRAVASGSVFIRPLRSKYAAIVEAIETAMSQNAVNGKYSVNVGDLSFTDKTFDEMVKYHAYYKLLAESEESSGNTSGVGLPQFTIGEFA